MSDKTEQITRELSDFLTDIRKRDDLSPEQAAEISHWATYASRQRGELDTRAAIGAISPAEHEQRLNALADEVIGAVGAATMDDKLRKFVRYSGMSEAEYARKLYRGDR